jgi:hypothetical protein
MSFAFHAGFRVDFVVFFALGDRFCRADALASTAIDTGIFNM